MENCVVQEITYIDEFLSLCEIASKSKHPNAKNYDVAQMKKRWNKYLIITKLTKGDEVIAFSGVYDYGNNLVRVVDRLYIEQKYRYNFMTKSIANPIKPALQYFIPYQTQWATDKGYDCFFSIQTKRKRNAMERLTRQLHPSLGYRLLPNLYETCDPKNPLCIQNISATSDDIPLTKHLIVDHKK